MTITRYIRGKALSDTAVYFGGVEMGFTGAWPLCYCPQRGDNGGTTSARGSGGNTGGFTGES